MGRRKKLPAKCPNCQAARGPAKDSEAPAHLSEWMRWFYSGIDQALWLDPGQLFILEHACEAWDAAEKAREVIEKKGQTYEDRFGQPKERPEVAIHRNNMLAFAKLLRECGIFDPERVLRELKDKDGK